MSNVNVRKWSVILERGKEDFEKVLSVTFMLDFAKLPY